MAVIIGCRLELRLAALLVFEPLGGSNDWSEIA
jgi:hypothetical protein